jgi:hypothetical protein
MATEAEKVNSPKFEIYLGGVELSADQAKQLEATLQKTAMRFLAGMDAAPKEGEAQAKAPTLGKIPGSGERNTRFSRAPPNAGKPGPTGFGSVRRLS